MMAKENILQNLLKLPYLFNDPNYSLIMASFYPTSNLLKAAFHTSTAINTSFHFHGVIFVYTRTAETLIKLFIQNCS